MRLARCVSVADSGRQAAAEQLAWGKAHHSGGVGQPRLVLVLVGVALEGAALHLGRLRSVEPQGDGKQSTLQH